MTSEQCEPKADDSLYSGAPLTTSTSVVLLLTFVNKQALGVHKSSEGRYSEALLL